MIPEEILQKRALRWVCDEHKLTLESLKRLDSARLSALQDYTISVADDMRYNQLKYFRPFDYQKKFFLTGKEPRRGILAANRIGKTVSTCYETALHLTGEYPDWWEGHKFTTPITAFVAGEGWQQVALVLQAELMGSVDVKQQDNIGTGMIPRKNVVFDSIRSDGPNILTVEILHKTGQKSTLIFGNYTQEVRQLQGFKLNLVVFDEQPPDDTFSELVTRTATTQGQVLCSFTPLKGLNGLVSKFWNHEDGYEFIRVSWDDVPEYDPWDQPFLLKTTREQLERDYLPYEREARIRGIPVMGLGAVFMIKNWPTYKGSEIDLTGPHMERLIALDLGLVNDATVISLMYWDPREKIGYLHKQLVIGGRSRLANGETSNIDEANPTGYIQHLMQPTVFGAPIVLPADANTAGRYTMSALSIRELFESYGLNVYEKAIMNPPDQNGKITNDKNYGINAMRQMLEAGSLMINENCVEFLRQAQNYFVDKNGRFSDPDDAIDSARYALLGCLQGISEPVRGGREAKFAEAKLKMESIRVRKINDRPDYKMAREP